MQFGAKLHGLLQAAVGHLDVVMVSKVVSLEQLLLGSDFDPHRVPLTFGLVLHPSYDWKITITNCRVFAN